MATIELGSASHRLSALRSRRLTSRRNHASRPIHLDPVTRRGRTAAGRCAVLKLFRPYRGRLAIVGLLVGAWSLVTVATPFLLKETLDVAIPRAAPVC